MKTKKSLGQFYTTNYEYILSGLTVPDNITKIIEPFCGNGDLLNIIDTSEYELECYDIDPLHDYITKRDTILNPPDYSGAFVLTNPPYLSRNKCKDKTIFNMFGVNDLYKCHIKDLLTNTPIGGIVIVPLNFFCSIRKMDVDLRRKFLNTYAVLQLNIFEEKVFEDTSYTVCAFQYEYKPKSNKPIPIKVHPSGKVLEFFLNKKNNYTIGGEIYMIPETKNYTITRLIEGGEPNTQLLLKAIDDSEKSKIILEYVNIVDIYYGKVSSRTYATLVINPVINKATQRKLADEFNKYIGEMREKYNSLFLSNYRESKDIARKRISFDLVYRIVGMLLDGVHVIKIK